MYIVLKSMEGEMDFPAKMRERLVRQGKRAPRRLIRHLCRFMLQQDEITHEELKQCGGSHKKFRKRLEIATKGYNPQQEAEKYSRSHFKFLPHGYLYEDEETVICETTKKLRGRRKRNF